MANLQAIGGMTQQNPDTVRAQQQALANEKAVQNTLTQLSMSQDAQNTVN